MLGFTEPIHAVIIGGNGGVDPRSTSEAPEVGGGGKGGPTLLRGGPKAEGGGLATPWAIKLVEGGLVGGLSWGG